MKKIKALVAILFIALVSIIIYSCTKENILTPNAKLETRAAGNSCIDGLSEGCDSLEAIEFDVFGIDMPGYNFDSCDFRVRVQTCIQGGSGGTQVIFVGDFVLLSSCQAYSDTIQSFVSNPNIGNGAINTFLAAFDLAMFDRLEYYILDHYGISGGQLANVSITFVRPACMSNCIYSIFVPDGPGPGDGGGKDGFRKGENSSNRDGDGSTKYFTRKAPCDSNGCCRRQTSWEYNPVTNMLDKKVSYTLAGGNGNPQSQCAGGTADPVQLGGDITLIRCLPCNYLCPTE